MAFVEMLDKIDAANTYAIADHKLASGTAPDYNQICKDLLAASGGRMDVIRCSHLAVRTPRVLKAVRMVFGLM